MTPKILIDWDKHQVRLLLLEEQSGRVLVRDARSAPLSGEAASVEALAEEIASAFEPLLTSHGRSKSDAIVLVGGRDVQFRLFRVPPVPKDELPDLVRLRATSEFPSVDENGIIDYQRLDSPAGEPQRLLVGYLSGESAMVVRQVCEKLHLTPESIVPRGCGLAALALRRQPDLATGTHVVVGRRPHGIDLVALHQGATAAIRSIPLQAEADETQLVQSAAREIRRTLASVSSELGLNEISSIVWLTNNQDEVARMKLVGREIGQTIESIAIDLHSDSEGNIAGDIAGDIDKALAYAGLLGVGESAAAHSLAIDFLSPKKRLEKTSPKRAFALAGVAALLIAAGASWWLYDQVASVERQTVSTNEKRQQIEGEIKRLQPEQQQYESVKAWLATDVNWLDEVDRLSLQLRPQTLDDKNFDAPNDILLTSLVASKASGARGTGGTIVLKGRARDDRTLQVIEKRLRDNRHEVHPKGVVKSPEGLPYVWDFQADLVVTPETNSPSGKQKQP